MITTERLEELKKLCEKASMVEINQLHSATHGTCLYREKPRELIELIEALEAEREKVRALSAALEFYAESDNYENYTECFHIEDKKGIKSAHEYETSTAKEDNGNRARKALEQVRDKT